jgi:hypothetical protein
VAAQRKSIWEKRQTPAVFRSEGICRRKEGLRRWPRWPHHPLARPGLGRATRGCEPLMAPWHGRGDGHQGGSSSVGLLVKSDFCNIFRDFSWKLDFCTKTRHQGNSAENSVSPCQLYSKHTN